MFVVEISSIVQHLSDGTWLSNGPYQKGLEQLKNYNACQNFPNPGIKNVSTRFVCFERSSFPHLALSISSSLLKSRISRLVRTSVIRKIVCNLSITTWSIGMHGNRGSPLQFMCMRMWHARFRLSGISVKTEISSSGDDLTGAEKLRLFNRMDIPNLFSSLPNGSKV